MSRREVNDQDRMIERRKARIRRQRRRKRIRRICLVILSILILAGSIPYIIKNVKAGTVFLDPSGRKIESGEEASAEGSAETSPDAGSQEDGLAADVPDSQSSENESADEGTDDSEADSATAEEVTEETSEEVPSSEPDSALREWTYTTDSEMPEGDIVDMHADGYSYERMRRDLYLLGQRYPSFMTVYQFGTSLDNRELLDAVVGDPAAERDVIIQYSIHAREHIVTNLGMKQLEELLKTMETGEYNGRSLREIFSKVKLHIIPMLNPDGVMISQGGLEAIGNEELRNGLMKVFEDDKALGKASPDIAEYTATWKANARSVDLNRNFDTPGWTTEMGTRQPSCSRYPGTGPNSEPEVQALIALTDSINCVAQIAYHCHGRLIYWDYGMAESDPDLYAKDQQLAQLFNELTTTENLQGYMMVSTVDDGQNPGGCSDYYMQVRHIPAVTVEVGNKFKADGSFNDAPLSIDQIDGIYAENAAVLPAVAAMFME